MARQPKRRGPAKKAAPKTTQVQPARLVPVIDEDAEIDNAVKALFGGKGDHDNDGKAGGAAPSPAVIHPNPVEPVMAEVEPVVAEPVTEIAEPEPRQRSIERAIPRGEKTLAQLNAEAWGIDSAMEQQRVQAEANYAEHVAPLLANVQPRRARFRRMQKPVRNPVVN